MGRAISASRLLIDGSFVTEKLAPNDIDAVILLPADFVAQAKSGSRAAAEIEEMLSSRRPEELFGAEDLQDWHEWIAFFSQTRELDGRRKGIVEIIL